MKKSAMSFRSIAAAVPLMALFPLTAAAQLPVFDNWSVTDGTVTPGACPDGFVCTTVVEEAQGGFIQRQLVDTANQFTYIQTIITDPGVTGSPLDLPFSDESFVRQGAADGILSNQRQTDPDANFLGQSQLQVGWGAPSPGNDTILISQTFDTPGELQSSFDMNMVLGAGGGMDMTIGQVALLDAVTGDSQIFVLEQRSGSLVPGAGSLTLPNFSATDGGAGGTVEWAAGEEVMVNWIGQTLDIGSEGVLTFGFQGARNNSTAAEANTFSLIESGPFAWDVLFGDQPSL